MTQDTRRLQCPCCHKRLEFDTATGELREVDTKALAPTRSKPEIEELVARQKREKERLGDAFSRAADDASTQADKFDDLFHAALDAAKKDKDKKPPNPFDLE